MKHLLLLSIVLSLSPSALAQARNVLHIILVGGQSNAVGQDSAKNLPAVLRRPQKSVPFFYEVVPRKGQAKQDPVYTTLRPGASPLEDGVGPEISFGREIADFHRKAAPGDRVAIIKYAHGGTNLYSQWKPGGDATSKGDGYVYRNFQRVVGLGLKALKTDRALKDYDFRIDAMLWVQGEADLSHDHATDYGDNLAAFIADVRLTYQDDLAFYFTRISSNQTLYRKSKDPKVLANYSAIRENQQAVAETVENTSMVDIDGRQFSMLAQSHYKPYFLHFDAKGTVAIGEAFATAYIGNAKDPK